MKNIRYGTCLVLFSLCAWVPTAWSQDPSVAAPTAAVSAAPNAPAQVPRLVRYSGTLLDSNGKPQSGVVGVSFLFYKDQAGGGPLWMETQNVTVDARGRYSVLLGSSKPDGLPTDLFAGGEARWLAVQPEGEAEQPRVLLLSVPYALKAGDAETLGGKPLSAFQLVTPESSSGSVPASTAAAEQANEITCASGTSCQTAFVPLFTSNGGSTKVSDSVISQIGSTVDVGGSVNVSGGVVGLTGFFHSSNGGAIFQATNGGAGDALAGVAQGINGAGVSGRGVTGVSGFGLSNGKTFGVEGLSLSSNGTGLWGLGQGQSHIGQHVGCCGPVGIWGDTSSNTSGAAGLVGTADDGFALVVENNSTTHLTASIQNDTTTLNTAILTVNAPGTGQFCNINTSGVLFCSGSHSLVVPVDNSQRQVALHAVESPQNWFEDFGSGHLASGAATIALEPTFAQTVNTGSDYHVFLTPKGECRGLYVSNESATGFEVHELGGGQSNVAFDYRVVALRRGYENVRLEDQTEMVAKTRDSAGLPLAEPFTASALQVVVPTKPASVSPSH